MNNFCGSCHIKASLTELTAHFIITGCCIWRGECGNASTFIKTRYSSLRYASLWGTGIFVCKKISMYKTWQIFRIRRGKSLEQWKQNCNIGNVALKGTTDVANFV